LLEVQIARPSAAHPRPTWSIYSRYAIADESMLRDTAARLERLHAEDAKEKKLATD
jgi:hypothetical protein